MFVDAHVSIDSEDAIVAARAIARDGARNIGFSSLDQARIATAVSELARNVVRYATGSHGEMFVRAITNETRTGIEIIVRDDGPGIENLELALEPGYTSASGLGLGLSGTKRLMDEFSIESTVGSGTAVTIRKWRR